MMYTCFVFAGIAEPVDLDRTTEISNNICMYIYIYIYVILCMLAREVVAKNDSLESVET